MDANLKEKLPQEGTSDTGESLPEHSSGCPTYSGGGINLRLQGTVSCKNEIETVKVEVSDTKDEKLTLNDDTKDEKPKSNIFWANANQLLAHIPGAGTTWKHMAGRHIPGSNTSKKSKSTLLYHWQRQNKEHYKKRQKKEYYMARKKADIKRKKADSTRKKVYSSRKKAFVTHGAHTIRWINMAIIADDYPDMLLEEDMYHDLQCLLWEKLEATWDPVPILNMGLIKKGVLKIACEGEYSSSWLQTIDGEVLNGVQLKVVYEKDLPTFQI